MLSSRKKGSLKYRFGSFFPCVNVQQSCICEAGHCCGCPVNTHIHLCFQRGCVVDSRSKVGDALGNFK